MIYDRDDIFEDLEEAAGSFFGVLVSGALLGVAIWLEFWTWLQIVLAIPVVINAGRFIFSFLICVFKVTVNFFALILRVMKTVVLAPFRIARWLFTGAMKAVVRVRVGIAGWLCRLVRGAGFVGALVNLEKFPNRLRFVVATVIFFILLFGGYRPHPDFSVRFLGVLLASGLLMELIVIGVTSCVRWLAQGGAVKMENGPSLLPGAAAPESGATPGKAAEPGRGTATPAASSPAPDSESAEPGADAELGKNAETDDKVGLTGNAELIGSEMPDEKAVHEDMDAAGREKGDRKGTEPG